MVRLKILNTGDDIDFEINHSRGTVPYLDCAKPMATILVIDDEPQLRNNLAELLELNDLAVLEAPNGAVGVELAKSQLPDLVVCDVNMPEIDGYQVLSQLRNNVETALIPVIFLTGLSGYSDLRQGMEKGVDDYLAKPVDPHDLLKAIDAQLEKRQQIVSQVQALQVSPSSLQGSAYQDSLTGLLSLPGIEHQFNQLRQRISVEQPVYLAVLKVDNYGEVQERFGHVFGALVIKTIAGKLQTWAEEFQPQQVSLAYIGSERFLVLAENLFESSVTAQLEELLYPLLEAPIAINNHTVQVQLRSSSAIHPRDGQDFNRCFIKAMRNLVPLGPKLTKPNYQGGELSMEARLKRALKQDEFDLFYQPQIDLKTGHIIGAEALLRWHPSDGPAISPAQFIPVAEESNLILSIGEWVLRAACAQLNQWHHSACFAITTAINLSAKQFQSPHFQHRLVTILEEEGISPALLDLELTESLLIEDIETTCKMLKSLQEMGFCIAIDDFGTGYSSLGYLQQLPINILKIDKCFIRDLDSNSGNMIIVKAIIDMAHGLNITTIAEGVETAEELAALKQVKCEAMQGYLFSPAIAADAFEKLLLNKRKEHESLLINCQ